MTKLNLLRGVANNLAESFISSTNIDSIKNLPLGEVRIDLLSETIGPTTESRELGIAVMRYHSWFNEEVKKAGIEHGDISRVLINLARKPEGQKIRYSCSVEIDAAGKRKFTSEKSWLWNL